MRSLTIDEIVAMNGSGWKSVKRVLLEGGCGEIVERQNVRRLMLTMNGPREYRHSGSLEFPEGTTRNAAVNYLRAVARQQVSIGEK